MEVNEWLKDLISRRLEVSIGLLNSVGADDFVEEYEEYLNDDDFKNKAASILYKYINESINSPIENYNINHILRAAIEFAKTDESPDSELRQLAALYKVKNSNVSIDDFLDFVDRYEYVKK